MRRLRILQARSLSLKQKPAAVVMASGVAKDNFGFVHDN
jgi:hypothetical protein